MKGKMRMARVSWMAGALLPMLGGIVSAGSNATLSQTQQAMPQNQPMAAQQLWLSTAPQRIADEYIPALGYDRNAFRTVQGTVTKVVTLPIRGTSQQELRLTVRADNGHSVEVDVGPLGYVQYQHVAFQRGDRVLIYGSLIWASGRNILVAAQIRTPYQVLTMRTPEGTPLWNLNRAWMSPPYGRYDGREHRPYAYPYGY